MYMVWAQALKPFQIHSLHRIKARLCRQLQVIPKLMFH